MGLSINNFYGSYRPVHGYLSVFICSFGVVSNIVNVSVFTRRGMKESPVNLILTALSVSDTLFLCDYFAWAMHHYIFHPHETYELALHATIHYTWFLVFLTISSWLTVLLAVWRNIAIRYVLS